MRKSRGRGFGSPPRLWDKFPAPLASEKAVEVASCDLTLDDRPSWLVSGLTCLHCFFRNGNPDGEQEVSSSCTAKESLIIYFSYLLGIYLAF